jgi:hypothetical protein
MPAVRRGLVALVVVALGTLATGIGAATATTHPGRAAPHPHQVVTILGDSVMVDGAPGVQAILQSTKRVTVYRRAFPGYSLTKADWRTDYTRILDATQPTGVAILLGGFDLAYAAAHPAAYGTLIGQVMDLLTSRGAQVAWIGELPGAARFENDAQRRNLNSIIEAQAASRPAVHWVSSDATFDGPNGHYAMFLPGAGGHLERLRKVDGQHLCPAGAARLGQLVYGTLRTPLDLSAPARNWQSGSWRQDPVYTMSTAYNARTLKLTTNVCPPA